MKYFIAVEGEQVQAGDLLVAASRALEKFKEQYGKPYWGAISPLYPTNEFPIIIGEPNKSFGEADLAKLLCDEISIYEGLLAKAYSSSMELVYSPEPCGSKAP